MVLCRRKSRRCCGRFFCLEDDVCCFDADKIQVFLRVGQDSPDFMDSTLSPHGSGNECLLTIIR